jgi:hypothetical protein
MAKHRSPNCPQIPFAEAIEKGRKVYEKEHTHPAARLVVAQDLGYKGLSGPSLALVGALRQYGILEGSGDALRISKDALAYYEMDNGPEKMQAIQRMIFAPALFEELHQQYGTKLPSEGNLRHTLITKGFLPDTAEDVIEVYKANIELVAGEESGYSGGESEVKEPSAMNPGITPSLPKAPTPGVQTYAFALSPDARAELSLKGTITADDLEILRDHIELTIKALARTTKHEAPGQ